jgi:hypothetical protein
MATGRRRAERTTLSAQGGLPTEAARRIDGPPSLWRASEDKSCVARSAKQDGGWGVAFAPAAASFGGTDLVVQIVGIAP